MRRHTWERWRHGGGLWCAPQMGNLQIPNWSHLQIAPPPPPPQVDLEGHGTATKELEEAVEGFGRALRVIHSGEGLAICEDPLGGGGRKGTRAAPSMQTSNGRYVVGRCPNWTNDSTLDVPSQDASIVEVCRKAKNLKNGKDQEYVLKIVF